MIGENKIEKVHTVYPDSKNKQISESLCHINYSIVKIN